jgi:hypothetical protein
MTSLDIFFGDVLGQLDEIAVDAKRIVDKRVYQRLEKEDTQLFINIDKHVTEEEYLEHNNLGIAIEELFEERYGKSLVRGWRNEY